eukprot:15472055-Alexandrium_andersonii.AAC.1
MAVAAAAWPAPSNHVHLAEAAGGRLHRRCQAAWGGMAAARPPRCCYYHHAWEAGRWEPGAVAAARPALGSMRWRHGVWPAPLRTGAAR